MGKFYVEYVAITNESKQYRVSHKNGLRIIYYVLCNFFNKYTSGASHLHLEYVPAL